MPKFPISRRSNAPSNKIQRGIINYCLAPSGWLAHTHTQKHREKHKPLLAAASAAVAVACYSRIIRVNCCKHVHCRGPPRAAHGSQPARLILSAILIIICQLVQKIACLTEGTAVEDWNRVVSLSKGRGWY